MVSSARGAKEKHIVVLIRPYLCSGCHSSIVTVFWFRFVRIMRLTSQVSVRAPEPKKREKSPFIVILKRWSPRSARSYTICPLVTSSGVNIKSNAWSSKDTEARRKRASTRPGYKDMARRELAAEKAPDVQKRKRKLVYRIGSVATDRACDRSTTEYKEVFTKGKAKRARCWEAKKHRGEAASRRTKVAADELRNSVGIRDCRTKNSIGNGSQRATLKRFNGSICTAAAMYPDVEPAYISWVLRQPLHDRSCMRHCKIVAWLTSMRTSLAELLCFYVFHAEIDGRYSLRNLRPRRACAWVRDDIICCRGNRERETDITGADTAYQVGPRTHILFLPYSSRCTTCYASHNAVLHCILKIGQHGRLSIRKFRRTTTCREGSTLVCEHVLCFALYLQTRPRSPRATVRKRSHIAPEGHAASLPARADA
ncbi:unnamed protein product [Rangifer tarandus platyrhynchus]|uniref:Uncharacterized protein n=1 Tax=Rangifer tarandus platyrhynchus TaxID=3082113 RepID=A0ABN8XJB0_RANTA|nr:unnamed protein product [Rangifer tarandus platyrhynchus]